MTLSQTERAARQRTRRALYKWESALERMGGKPKHRDFMVRDIIKGKATEAERLRALAIWESIAKSEAYEIIHENDALLACYVFDSTDYTAPEWS